MTRFTEGYAASVAPLSRGAAGVRRTRATTRRWLWLACRFAQDLWDDELWYELATRGVRVARATGALSLLPLMANYLAAFNVHSGAFATAAALIDEVEAITLATGMPPMKYSAGMLAAMRGDEVQAKPLFAFGFQTSRERGEGAGARLGGWLTACCATATAATARRSPPRRKPASTTT